MLLYNCEYKDIPNRTFVTRVHVKDYEPSEETRCNTTFINDYEVTNCSDKHFDRNR